MEFVELEIINWSRYNPRKDIKEPTWFRLSNRILDSGSMAELSAEEFKVWIYILCQASQKCSSTIKVYFRHAMKTCDVQRKVIFAVIEKMEKDESIRVHVRTRDVDVPSAVVRVFNPVAYTTDTTLQTDTTDISCASGDALPVAGVIWNSRVKDLPKLRAWTKTRAKAWATFLKSHSQQDFENLCDKVQASEFLSGRSGKWTSCSFDWVLKPANTTKILEGNYDNRDAAASNTIDWSKYDDAQGEAL